MFYAAGHYNYAHECMELLHNLIHDWPSKYAEVALNGMIINPSGQPAAFKPTDIHVEHLNYRIKERAHGTNATPDLLEKYTPVMGYVRSLTDRISRELGVESRNQVHAHVTQRLDIELLVGHLAEHEIFNFALDTLSEHAVV